MILCEEVQTTNWEAIIATGALIISLVSVIFTWQQLKIQRVHNLKSIKPIGRIRIGDYENKIYVAVENSGIGPMILNEILAKNNSREAKEKFIDILSKELTDRVVWTDFTGRYPERSILPGSMLNLLVWTPNDSYDNKPEAIEIDKKDLRNELKDIKLIVTYTDIYESTTYKTELEFKEWFGRHES
ncbi:hypothetical protein [Flavobacterium sp. CF136]|uniref:hypothetical protein n=1 Tax=Flavobacterium sp. (strain CF136) TaxID=1144313 RepID=UPI000271855E|nr:hypothetical protein [Flavobacterium sp. CF136]EJL63951.1 hypothetical protein PMI10_02183 [Flavobacterium sp. CF136]